MEKINTPPMTTEMAFDAMEQLLPHLAEVINDVEVKRLTDFAKTEEGKNSPASDLMAAMLPLFITKHREAMMHIVAVFKGVSVDEARAMPFKDTLDVLRDNFMGDMLLFFMLCLRMACVR